MSYRSGVKERGRLKFFCAPARAGKSTIANQWKDAGWIVLGGDDFRLALHGREYAHEAEGIVASMIDVCAKALLGRGYNVLMDETCTTETTLLRYLRLDLNAEPIFLDTPEQVCVERAKQSGHPELIPVIQRHCRQLKELRANWDKTVEKLKNYLTNR